MVQGIMELLFDAAYLIFAFVVGVYLIVKGNGKYFKLFGVMAVVLSSGDAFHLVPRVYSLLTTGLEANAFALGLGKLITSVTMTAFYVILYFILESVWRPEGKVRLANRIAVFALALARIALCAPPQNDWFSGEGSLLWGILRNIPFAILGIQIIVICFLAARKLDDKSYVFMGVMVILSFAFYIPVVLFASAVPMIGMLMIPKTLAYVGVVAVGLYKFRKEKKSLSVQADALPADPAPSCECPDASCGQGSSDEEQTAAPSAAEEESASDGE